MRRRLAALLMFAALALCGQPAAAELQLFSPAFADGEMIPVSYTCEGADQPLPLHWQGAPAGTRSLVLMMEDPDAPDPAAPRMIWVHWIVYNLPADSAGMVDGRLPSGAAAGVNSWGERGYGGPCPPIGEHRYFFRLYALDRILPQHTYARQSLLAAMQGHILASTELMGRYHKQH